MSQIRSLLTTCALCLLLFACGKSTEADPKKESTAASEVTPENVSADLDVTGKWAKNCALCHVSGVGGAPRLGFAEDWKPRLVKGRATLLLHTIEGHNNMPPLGYCMSCEEEDFVALIDFMLGEAP